MLARYLPEYHNFIYIAHAPWPIDPRTNQQDWIYAVEDVQQWLEKYTGPHLKEWAFSTDHSHDYWEACIAFRRERSKTLFLLQWS
jgi:hypothetical protein